MELAASPDTEGCEGLVAGVSRKLGDCRRAIASSNSRGGVVAGGGNLWVFGPDCRRRRRSNSVQVSRSGFPRLQLLGRGQSPSSPGGYAQEDGTHQNHGGRFGRGAGRSGVIQAERRSGALGGIELEDIHAGHQVSGG